MDLQFYGANCIVLSSRNFRVVIDDNLANLGGKSILKTGDIALTTSPIIRLPEKSEPKIVIGEPGEYEVGDVSIYGVATRGHMDEPGQQTATMYKLEFGELAVLVTGHIYPDLTDAQLEQIGEVDVMFVPVGGNGYTLDAVGALKLIRAVEPKLVVPTHYADKSLKYEVPQRPLDDALKELAMEPKETTTKLKLKASELTDVTQLVVLEKSA